MKNAVLCALTLLCVTLLCVLAFTGRQPAGVRAVAAPTPAVYRATFRVERGTICDWEKPVTGSRQRELRCEGSISGGGGYRLIQLFDPDHEPVSYEVSWAFSSVTPSPTRPPAPSPLYARP